MYNLIAQRDNKSGFQLAELSLETARTAKDDSFVMFTLAVMSILFLPGTAIVVRLSCPTKRLVLVRQS